MLRIIAEKFVYNILQLKEGTRFAESVEFFIYDSLKIFFLLFVLISVIGVLRTLIPQQKIKQWLNKKGIFGYLYASFFGAVTPFCSCSSIPIFFSFLKAGIPLGVSLSFLITSPIINEYLVVLMFGFFGLKVTILYIFSGIMLGVISGLILGRMKLEKHIVDDFAVKEELKDVNYGSFQNRIKYGVNEAVVIIKKIWLWILIGVGLGAAIHNYVPQETVQAIIGKTGIFSVPIAVLIGVPMYGSCAAIVPIAVVLFQKGVPLGTALSFMMAIAALSLPEAVMLRRAMKLPLILLFFGITTIAIIITGYLFNMIAAFMY